MKKYFQFEELGTNYRREFVGGFTTFLAMAYILVVNPITLTLADVKDLPDALRMDYGAVFVATALAAAVGSIIMGLVGKYPIALAPGMGLNAFFAYSVVLGNGAPWQHGLAAVFISSVFFLLLTISGLREKIINAIPVELKHAVGAGIGLFITFVGFKNAGIIVNNDATLVGLGDLTHGNTLLAIFGLLVTVIMMTRGVKGAVFYGMALTVIAGMIFNLIEAPQQIVGPVPSLEPTFGALFSAFGDPSFYTSTMLGIILTFLFVDFFDNAGTLVAVANQAGMMKENKLPRAGRALFADSIASMLGSIFGTSTVTSYIESSAGVASGARTGFASLVTAGFFLLSLFFFPVLSVVTSPVTAPALIIVGVLMVSSLGKIDWSRFEIAVPAFLTVITMPLSYSIATGIAAGFIFYPVTMMVKGRTKEIHPIMYLFFVIFVLYFMFLTE
ncbi:NCS2 family permease [Mesobacillus foraminis]|uniref:AGZA family xanthine/uracil permease-like MFS transporter n=1 Tax=Mesobacillus foraminis TaxID=279826 RepID=A0A4R2AVT4_9BACI|nr:NCS2 family permease [Mesobacillus foraminis]TCN18078.1 AGZA family xanthine/uracil permease-like MFS transporter [Mesobacillus foraminis]